MLTLKVQRCFPLRLFQSPVLLCRDQQTGVQESKVEHLREVAHLCGATCLPEKGRPAPANWDAVTHVVAVNRDSSEVAWAQSAARPAVRPAWLLCCAHTWYKVRSDGLPV